MQFHLTLKEIAQQPWEQGKCQVVSVTRSLLHQCPVLYKTVLPLLNMHCSEQRAPARGLITAESWNHLMLSWMCLGFPFHFYCQLMSSLSHAAAGIGLSAYSNDLILFLFFQSLKLSMISRTVCNPPLC